MGVPDREPEGEVVGLGDDPSAQVELATIRLDRNTAAFNIFVIFISSIAGD